MLGNTRKVSLFFSLNFFLLIGCQTSTNHSTSFSTQETKIEIAKLMGTWQSISNPQNRIELTKDRMYSYYGELKLADEYLVVYDNCIARCLPKGVNQMPCIVTDGKQAQNCFEILELTDKKLSYALLGQDLQGERKIMKFQKM